MDLPRVTQETDHTCGAAALLAICRYFGGIADEASLVRFMGFGADGSDPEHVVAGARACGLHHREYRSMTDDQLRASLDAGQPVMLTLQLWDDGHWIVAVAHDPEAITYIDPWPASDGRCRMRWAELAQRWYDVEGPGAVRLERYGIAIWRSSM